MVLTKQTYKDLLKENQSLLNELNITKQQRDYYRDNEEKINKVFESFYR